MKRSCYDVIYPIFIILILFTVGIHIGKNEERPAAEEKQIAVNVSKIKGIPICESAVKIDGKYTAMLISANENILTLTVSGESLDAGFFAFRAKYICHNQPISLFAEWGYAEGRIIAIY
jgi:hypothetical protein